MFPGAPKRGCLKWHCSNDMMEAKLASHGEIWRIGETMTSANSMPKWQWIFFMLYYYSKFPSFIYLLTVGHVAPPKHSSLHHLSLSTRCCTLFQFFIYYFFFREARLAEIGKVVYFRQLYEIRTQNAKRKKNCKRIWTKIISILSAHYGGFVSIFSESQE